MIILMQVVSICLPFFIAAIAAVIVVVASITEVDAIAVVTVEILA